MVNLTAIRLVFFIILLFCMVFPQAESLENNIQFIKLHNPIILEDETFFWRAGALPHPEKYPFWATRKRN